MAAEGRRGRDRELGIRRGKLLHTARINITSLLPSAGTHSISYDEA